MPNKDIESYRNYFEIEISKINNNLSRNLKSE